MSSSPGPFLGFQGHGCCHIKWQSWFPDLTFIPPHAPTPGAPTAPIGIPAQTQSLARVRHVDNAPQIELDSALL